MARNVMERLARFARVVVMDHRGTGLSDRLPPGDVPPLETQMDDLAAVMQATGIERAHLFGNEDGAELLRPVRGQLPRAGRVTIPMYAMLPRRSATTTSRSDPDKQVSPRTVFVNAASCGLAGGVWLPLARTTNTRRRRSPATTQRSRGGLDT